jgi:putative hydrolase of the HAD superfamily
MEKTMISTVIFDVGGVLIRTEDKRNRRALEVRLGLPPGRAEQLVFNNKHGRAAQLGQISAAELWASIGAELGLDTAGVAQFRQEFFAGDRLNEPLLAFVHSLRPRYQTAIISNFMDDLPTVITDVFPIAPAFDLIVGSAAEGVMKPNAEIFERTLARLGKRPEETVFVDDFIENVEGARAVGMHAIHYTPHTDVPAELAKLGVAV